jgi:hypothetical protein
MGAASRPIRSDRPDPGKLSAQMRGRFPFEGAAPRVINLRRVTDTAGPYLVRCGSAAQIAASTGGTRLPKTALSGVRGSTTDKFG